MAIYLLLVSLLLGMQTWAFKSGAPPSMCKDMMPHHSSSPVQTTPSPYALSVENTCTDDCGVLKVTVSGSQQFVGIMLEGRRQVEGEIIGKFDSIPANLLSLNCNGQSSAVTHADPSPKDKVTLMWEAPGGFDSDVTFVATVVYNYTTFWTRISSPPVKVKRAASSNVGVQSIPQSLYEGCGTRKNCVGSPLGCESKRNCNSLIAASKSGQNYEFEMMALMSKYVAVGLSQDNKMGGDSVLECAYENHREGFEGVNAYRSWNVPNQKANQRLDVQNGFTLRNGTYIDGSTYCKVVLDSVTSVGDVSFDINRTPYYLLLAAGTKTSEGKVHFHDVAYGVSLDSRLLSDLTPVMIHDSFYDGCNVDRSCFGYPDGCIASQSCRGVASILVQGTTYNFKLKSKEGAYIALGLSTDDKMGGDSVMECVQERNAVKLYASWNKPGEKSNTRKNINQGALKLLNSSYTDGVIFCEFTRDFKTQVMKTSYDLIQDKYFLLLAAGSSISGEGVGRHDIFSTASAQKRSLSEVSALNSQSKLFVRLHGSFMVAAWIGTASIGIILARYFKQTWVESSLCAKDLWFAWHRFFMMMTWCFTMVAFVLIFIDVGGWVSTESTQSLMHAIFGTITTVLCFIQPIGAALRPNPSARNRPLFNWLHWLIGNAAQCCAVLALFFVSGISKAELPGWLDWILVGYVVLYVALHLVLTISGCISDSKGEERINTFPLKDMNTSRSALNSVERRMDAPLSGFRKLMLFLHIVGVTAITAVIIIIICFAPIEAQFSSLQKKVMSV